MGKGDKGAKIFKTKRGRGRTNRLRAVFCTH